MFYGNDDVRDDKPSRAELNVHSMVRIASFACVALLFSTVTPIEILVPTLSSLLTMAAVACALVGTFKSDRVFANHLTRWDEAAVLLLLGVVVGTFGDVTVFGISA